MNEHGILPCPFCGNDGGVGIDGPRFHIYCRACYASPKPAMPSLAMAVDWWNRRAAPSTLAPHP